MLSEQRMDRKGFADRGQSKKVEKNLKKEPKASCNFTEDAL